MTEKDFYRFIQLQIWIEIYWIDMNIFLVGYTYTTIAGLVGAGLGGTVVFQMAKLMTTNVKIVYDVVKNVSNVRIFPLG